MRVAASRGTQSSIQSSPGPRRVFYSIRRSKILRSHALITHAHALQRPQQGGEKETDSAVLSAATIIASTIQPSRLAALQINPLLRHTPACATALPWSSSRLAGNPSLPERYLALGHPISLSRRTQPTQNNLRQRPKLVAEPSVPRPGVPSSLGLCLKRPASL